MAPGFVGRHADTVEWGVPPVGLSRRGQPVGAFFHELTDVFPHLCDVFGVWVAAVVTVDPEDDAVFILIGGRLGAEGEGEVGRKSSAAKFIAHEYAAFSLRLVELDQGLVAQINDFLEFSVEVEISQALDQKDSIPKKRGKDKRTDEDYKSQVIIKSVLKREYV